MKILRRLQVLALVTGWTGLSSCQPAQSWSEKEAEYVVEDVALVVTHETTLDEVPALNGPGREVLRLGDGESESAEGQFGWVADLRLEGEELTVVDLQASPIQIFDLTGRVRARFSDKGEGPGEYASAVLGRSVDGSRVLWDANQLRVLRFDSGGDYSGTLSVQDTDRITGSSPFSTGKDGVMQVVVDREESWLVLRTYPIRGAMGMGSMPWSDSLDRPFRDALAVVRLEPDGSVSPPLITLPGNEMVRIVENKEGRVGTVSDLIGTWGGRGFIESTNGGWIGGVSDRFEIMRWTRSAELVSAWRYPQMEPAPGEPPPPASWRHEREREVRAMPSGPPAYSDLRPGGSRFWVRLWADNENAPQEWLALDAETGTPQFRVTLPFSADVRQFTDQYIVTVEQGEFDEQMIVVFEGPWVTLEPLNASAMAEESGGVI